MKSNIPCEIIRDLLPLYTDQITSVKTNEEIENHLKECSKCKELLKAEKEEWEGVSKKINMEKREIDYLKKIRKKGRNKVILGAIFGVFVILLIFAAKFYMIGIPVYGYEADVNVKDNLVYIEGELKDTKLVYSKYKIVENEGESQFVIYACLPSFWNTNKNFYIKYPIKSIKQKLSVSGIKVMKDGTILSKMASKLYKEKNPYIGDMPNNLELARILNINLGIEMHSSLQTAKEPYGWTFEFMPLLTKKEADMVNQSMPIYACALLALIENASEISWTYSMETNHIVTVYRKTITLEEAKTILGAEAKSFAVSEEKIQEMIEILGFVS